MSNKASLLSPEGNQKYKGEWKTPGDVLALVNKAGRLATWNTKFDAGLDTNSGACVLVCRACKLGVSPNNISDSTNTHLRSCKGPPKPKVIKGSDTVDLSSPTKNNRCPDADIDSPSKNTRSRNLKLGVATKGLITNYSVSPRQQAAFEKDFANFLYTTQTQTLLKEQG